jgi:hypothetical protein
MTFYRQCPFCLTSPFSKHPQPPRPMRCPSWRGEGVITVVSSFVVDSWPSG